MPSPRSSKKSPSTSPPESLSPDQARVLTILPSCGGVVPGEVAFQAGLDEARIAVVMGELAALGLVRAWSWQRADSEGGAWGPGPREEGKART